MLRWAFGVERMQKNKGRAQNYDLVDGEIGTFETLRIAFSETSFSKPFLNVLFIELFKLRSVNWTKTEKTLFSYWTKWNFADKTTEQIVQLPVFSN